MLRKVILLIFVSVICGGILNESSGEIRAMDRNNDGLYDNNLECHWSIVCGPNQLVELKIVSIDLEKDIVCAFDYIEVISADCWLGTSAYMLLNYLLILKAI